MYDRNLWLYNKKKHSVDALLSEKAPTKRSVLLKSENDVLVKFVDSLAQ